MQKLSRLVILTGHYGSGKTNLSLNIAVALKRQGREVTLADLDIVNPYFRSADFAPLAQQHQIELIAPNFANTNLDAPSLPPALGARIDSNRTLVIDVGGDDAGAYALGRYAPRIAPKPYDLLYVINCYRYLTQQPQEALELLREIEAASRLKATGIINNSNLAGLTTPQELTASVQWAEKVSALAGIPLLATTAPRGLYETLPSQTGYCPVDIYVKAPWQSQTRAES